MALLYELANPARGTFLLKKRAEKMGRNISKGTSVKIPAHYIPKFKPSKEFAEAVRAKLK
jgi:DNA-binding protein HU-beta